MQDHFIRYYPYYFDPYDPYYLGKQSHTDHKHAYYDYRTPNYYTISNINFSQPQSNTSQQVYTPVNNDRFWKNENTIPVTSSYSNRNQYFQNYNQNQTSPSNGQNFQSYGQNHIYSISPNNGQYFQSYGQNQFSKSDNQNYDQYQISSSASVDYEYDYNSDDDDDDDLEEDEEVSKSYQARNQTYQTSSYNYSPKFSMHQAAKQQQRKPNRRRGHRHRGKFTNHKHPLSQEDIARQKIAHQNHNYVKKHMNLIDKNVETIDDSIHSKINLKITRPPSKGTKIVVTRFSTIDTAIYYHNLGYSKICVLNFADAIKPGGGYLNGRNAQEECLCRQTLLYPTLKASTMHSRYKADKNIYSNDIMVYSPNVYVIRDNSYSPIEIPFLIDIISAPAVDNRKYVSNAAHIMERRIRKIVKLAAYKKNNVLVLGAFGCGVFNNNPKEVARIFAKVLVNEGLKDYFKLVVFPIYKDDKCKKIFENALL